MRYFLAFLLFSTATFAQRNEAGLVLENDLFTSSVNDKYYTNGVEVFYRFSGHTNSEKVVKKTNEFRAGQYIYNPQTVKAANPNVHDRPFAGYLWAQVTKGWFFRDESVLKAGITGGVVGPSSGAEEGQKALHNLLGYKPVQGWNYQIRDLAVAQLNGFFAKRTVRSEHFDFNLSASGTFGTAFSSASVSGVSRVSLLPLLPMSDSALFGASVNENPDTFRTQTELFFYIAPGYSYQFYDATIQGSRFSDESPITWDLVKLRFIGEAGIKYRKNHWNLSYAFVYRGKEADNWVNKGYFYGSISASYLF